MRADLLEGILAFTRVAEKRSFTAAARELGVTPSAISWTIKQLEGRVGAPLLTRTTRSVGMTETGKLLLEQAQAGVAQIAAGYDAAQALGDRPSGLLRLNLPTVAQPVLEPVLPGFAETYPDIELELTIDDRFVDIVADGYDAGIRIGETMAQDMVAVRMTQPSAMAVVGSRTYFAKRGKPRCPEQLAEHACINFRLASGGIYRWAFEEKFDAGKVREFEIAVKGPLIVNGSGPSLSAAISGIGLAYNTFDNVEELVRQGVLEPCLEDFMPMMPGFFIYFPTQARALPKLRAFLDFFAGRNRLAQLAVK